MTTRNSAFCFNGLNKDHCVVNCSSKKNCQHSNCNKRHNTPLHRDFQIAGNSSHLTGRQSFRTVNKNQSPETSHYKNQTHIKNTASVHLTKKESTNICLPRNRDAEKHRTETKWKLCRFYQSTCTINTALQQCMPYLTVEACQAFSQRT